MEYEKAFTDFEKMRYESAWRGYKYKDYGMMYEYINKRLGNLDANFFMNQDKKWKRVFCARFVYLYHPEKEKQEEAKKFYERNKSVIE